jgi:hypothetical protein
MISGRSRELGRCSLALAVTVGADRLRDCLRMYPEVSGTAVETTARDEPRASAGARSDVHPAPASVKGRSDALTARIHATQPYAPGSAWSAPARCSFSSNSQVSGPSSEEPVTAPFVKEQRSRCAPARRPLRAPEAPRRRRPQPGEAVAQVLGEGRRRGQKDLDECAGGGTPSVVRGESMRAVERHEARAGHAAHAHEPAVGPAVEEDDVLAAARPDRL